MMGVGALAISIITTNTAWPADAARLLGCAMAARILHNLLQVGVVLGFAPRVEGVTSRLKENLRCTRSFRASKGVLGWTISGWPRRCGSGWR